MNDENLIPTNKRTKREQREIAKKGGQASGKARAKKKTLKEITNTILSNPVLSEQNKKTLEALGISDVDADNNSLLVASTFQQALKGDTRATALIQQWSGEAKQMSEYERKTIALKEKQLKAEQEAKKGNSQALEYKGIPSMTIAPFYAGLLRKIKNNEYTEYVCKGGRGSTKSSFISLVIIDLIMSNPLLNACVFRQVGNTISGSVYNQLVWAINELGINDLFHCTKNPAEIVKNNTGQRIFFRGADDPLKVKSIKPLVGYLGIVWFEELDQFNGPEAIRSIEQSAIRGGDIAYKFKSFNPPKSKNNWANEYCLLPKEDMLVTSNSYLDVPKEFLGQTFISDANFLKEVNPTAYEHEYLGIANGNGGNVFENVEIREISDEEIKEFDRIYQGVDWGWYPDPFAYVRMHYDSARMTLYIFGEYRANKKGNEETAKEISKLFNVNDGIIYCDSAEPKSVSDYKALGLPARAVEKGAGSVDYSMKWLARLNKIVIDPRRCVEATKEFVNYEYERDKEGNVISGYPDKENHFIDATRYAMFPVWRKRGQ